MMRVGSTVAPLLRRLGSRPLSLAFAAACAGLPASTALAGPRHGNVRLDIDLRGGTAVVEQRRECEPVYENRQSRVWVEPVYRTCTDRRWVEPVYRTVCDHVWREAVVNTVCDRVWVPDRYERRDVVRWAHGCRTLVREAVLVEPGHYDTVKHDVVVTPGHFEDVQRQELVCAGRWETTDRQELVSAGHWEVRTDRVVVRPGRVEDRPLARVDFGGVFGR
jgi:hypothetical protein